MEAGNGEETNHLHVHTDRIAEKGAYRASRSRQVKEVKEEDGYCKKRTEIIIKPQSLKGLINREQPRKLELKKRENIINTEMRMQTILRREAIKRQRKTVKEFNFKATHLLGRGFRINLMVGLQYGSID